MNYNDLLKAVSESETYASFQAKVKATMLAAPESDNQSQKVMEHASPEEISLPAMVCPSRQ